MKDQVNHMTDRVYFEPYANILVFYLYLTKDIAVIERIRNNAKNIYAHVQPATLESDIDGLNLLYNDHRPSLSLPESSIEENREAAKQQLDDMEQARQAAGNGERLVYSDELDELVKLNIALKTIYILGQVLRNFPGSLKGEVKTQIAEECYLLGLRVLGFVFTAVRENAEELRTYFARLMAERQPALTSGAITATADQAIQSIVELWGFAMIKTISHAVGMEELEETYKQVLALHSERLSIQIIDATIKLDHFGVFPSAQVDKLHKRVERNHIAYCILRQVIANHLYLFRTSHSVRQKYTQKFSLQPATGRLVEGGLSKAES